MEHNADVSEVQSSERSARSFRYLKPIDIETYGDRVNWLWGKISSQDYCFDDYGRGKPELFLHRFTDRNLLQFEIGESGYISVDNAWEGQNCFVHFAVWDKGFKDAKATGDELFGILFNELRVARVTGMIPVYNKVAVRFALTCGFKYEGEMRSAIKFQGVYHNVSIYGLLRNDWMKKRVQ